MTKAQRSAIILVACLAGGVLLQNMAKKEAAFLGLTALELSLLSAATGAALGRKML